MSADTCPRVMNAHDFIKAIAKWILEIPVNIPVWIRVLVIHWLIRL